MGFRTLEISHAAEIHIKEGQLEITTEEGGVVIPIEDLNQIMVHGANIRLSTMDLSILSQNKVAMMTLDEKYLPTAIVLPFEGHARQSKLMHAQVNTTDEKYLELWIQIIKQKISKQLTTTIHLIFLLINSSIFSSFSFTVFPFFLLFCCN